MGGREEVATGVAQMTAFYDACDQAQVARVLYLGGSIALRRHPQGLPGDESLDFPAQPEDRNPYVQVKWAMDQLARARARAGQHVVIGVPTMTFGEYDYGPTTGRFVDALVALIAELAQVPPPKVVPLGLARLVGAVQTLRYRIARGPPPKLGSTTLAVMASGQHLQGAKAERELGYRPEVGLRKRVSE